MKSFEQYLLEVLDVPNIDAGLKKRRHTMPQLSDFDAFVKDLKNEDIGMSDSSMKPSDLTPTQSNFNEDKVKSMVTEGNWKSKPIIVSKDGYVIDGHHRWLAANEAGSKVACRVIDLNAEDLLQFVDGKSYVEKKGINESKE